MSLFAQFIAAILAAAAALNAAIGSYGLSVFGSLLVVIFCTNEICAAIHRGKSR